MNVGQPHPFILQGLKKQTNHYKINYMHIAKKSVFALLISTFLNATAFAQKKIPDGISLLPADKSNVSIFIVLKDLPDQYFLFTIPEIFTGQSLKEGLFNADHTPWKINKHGAKRKLKTDKYQYQVKLKLLHTRNIYVVDWKITFTNNSTETLYDLAAFNCLTMDRAPIFKDTGMVRTWVKDQTGKTTSLSTIQKTQGPHQRTMQFYSAAGGITDLTKSNWINTWNVLSPATLSGNSVWIYSKDENWKIETRVNEQAAYFFNNWEADHGCIHASPLLARELKAGKTAVASGSFIFTNQ